MVENYINDPDNPFLNEGCGCGEIKTPCGCSEPKLCGCEKKIDLLCAFYSGEDLSPLGINKGMDGNLVIKIINDYISNLNPSDPSYTIIESVGDGLPIYKGISYEGKQQIKSIYSDNSITLEDVNDTVIAKVSEPWFKNLLTQNWFLILIQNLLNGEWFVTLLHTIFNTSTFQTWFANYITNLIVTEQIDICTLIAKCQPAPPVDNPPVISGDIVYNVGNRTINFPVNPTDFTLRYSDPEGDAYTSVKIIGGDLTGLIKKDNSPLALNDIIPVYELSGIRFSSPNQNSVASQIVNYVAINSKGQQSN